MLMAASIFTCGRAAGAPPIVIVERWSISRSRWRLYWSRIILELVGLLFFIFFIIIFLFHLSFLAVKALLCWLTFRVGILGITQYVIRFCIFIKIEVISATIVFLCYVCPLK